LNPYPYFEDEKHELNNELVENEICDGITRFKDSGLDVIELAESCSIYTNSTLGKYLFTLYSENVFDKELFERLAENNKIEKIMLDYAHTAYSVSQDNLKKAYQIAKKEEVSDSTIVNLLMIETIDAKKRPLVMEESEEIKKQYWKNYNRGMFASDKETAQFVISEMLKYSTHMSIIENLAECRQFFTADEILAIFEKINHYEVGSINSMSGYHVEELLSVLQDGFLYTEKCSRVAQIEIIYRGLVDVEKMVCMNRCLRETPDLYLQILAIIFKNDDGERVEGVEIEENTISSVFTLYYNLHFCPAEDNGQVNSDKLRQWIGKFRVGLKNNKQERLFDIELGRLFASSPIGDDGCYPAEGIRNAIEKIDSETLGREYETSIYNSRGIYSPSGGVEERKIAQRYKDNADRIRLKWPVTAKIYDNLHDRYIYEANSEREREEYAGV